MPYIIARVDPPDDIMRHIGAQAAGMPFCDAALAVDKRVTDLLSRIASASKPDLLVNNAKALNLKFKHRSQFFKMAQNLDLRYVLVPAPFRFMIGHSLGRMESRLQKFTPHCICRRLTRCGYSRRTGG